MKSTCTNIKNASANLHAHVNPTHAQQLAHVRGVTLNNSGLQLIQAGRAEEAIPLLQEALQLKLDGFGENSIPACISLSSLAEAYLAKYKEASASQVAVEADIQMAGELVARLGRAATAINSPEQNRIAREILRDINRITGERQKIAKMKSKDPVVTAVGNTISLEMLAKRCMYENCEKTYQKSDLRKCSRCCTMNYCCVECQKLDWKKHKPLCVVAAAEV